MASGKATECQSTHLAKVESEANQGFADGQGATYTVTGTQTDIGSSPNTFTYTSNSGTDANNYNITKIEGTLTVTVKTITFTLNNENKTCVEGTTLKAFIESRGEAASVLSMDGQYLVLSDRHSNTPCPA